MPYRGSGKLWHQRDVGQTMTAIPAPEGSTDSGVPWHYGDPLREQRRLAAGDGVVDLSNRGIVTVSGPDRLTWLNNLTTQQVARLSPGASALALVLDPRGHVEHELHLVDDGETTWLIVEPHTAGTLVDYLNSMRFMLRVEVVDASADYAVIWRPTQTVDPRWPTWLTAAEFSGTGVTESGADRGGDASRYVPARSATFAGSEVIVARDALSDYLGDTDLAGTWALEALRVAAAVPRLGFETDHKLLPHEVGWIGPGVHLTKGCYRGQETVARVHNMGKPPRRLVLLHLDGSVEALPSHGDDVVLGGRVVGWIGTAAQHYELGPIATAVVKRSIPADAPLSVRVGGGSEWVAAAQEIVVTAI